MLVVGGALDSSCDADKRKLIREIRNTIEHCWYQPELNAMVISDGTYFEAFNQDQTLWQSPVRRGTAYELSIVRGMIVIRRSI